MSDADWYRLHGCSHAHCPTGHDKPQPAMVDGRLLCMRCWCLNDIVSEMIPCTAATCDDRTAPVGAEGEMGYTLGPLIELERTYQIQLELILEDDGGFSAVAVNLPGAGSCGDTEAEAVANAREAVAAVLASYADGAIPWAPQIRPPEPCHRFITVRV